MQRVSTPFISRISLHFKDNGDNKIQLCIQYCIYKMSYYLDRYVILVIETIPFVNHTKNQLRIPNTRITVSHDVKRGF